MSVFVQGFVALLWSDSIAGFCLSDVFCLSGEFCLSGGLLTVFDCDGTLEVLLSSSQADTG